MTTESQRPNFLFIIADQLRADAVGAFGSTFARTPNIDALATRGTRFTNAFVQHTVCSPSRVSFLTGWYPHVRGHRTLTHLLGPDDPNLLKSLRADGYHVTHVGKRGDTWAPGGTEASCDEYGWIVEPDGGLFGRLAAADPEDPMARHYYVGEATPAIDFDEACTRTAEAWLGSAPTDRPWMLYVPMIYPHCPFGVEEPWYSLHDRAALPRRRPRMQSGHEPVFMDQLRAIHRADELDETQWREIAAVYHGMVSRLDDQIGRMLRSLGDQAENTVVVFFSDHGEYLGDYDLIEKWPSGLHDCLARDPLVMAGPGIPEATTVDAMVELIDLVPTIHELAHVEIGHTHFGRSLLPVMADPTLDHRPFAFTEGGFLPGETSRVIGGDAFPYSLKQAVQVDAEASVGKAVAVRSRRWTYVWRAREAPELYDRTADPDEVHNLAGDAELTEVEDEMRTTLLRWFVETGDILPSTPDPRFPEVELPRPGEALTAATGR